MNRKVAANTRKRRIHKNPGASIIAIEKAKGMSAVGTGIYTPREVARLTGLSVARVSRWVSGYSFKYKTELHHSAPLIASQDKAGSSLTFLDLIEVLFVKAFLEHGVKMWKIRQAAQEAKDEFGTHHPFAVRRFETDGCDIVARIASKGRATDCIVNVINGQTFFTEIISRYLKQIDYNDFGDAFRWWPLGKEAPVFVDPKFSFGTPLTKSGHVPTHAIHCALEAGDSAEDVARWFEIPLEEVRAAEMFHQQRMAA